MLSLEVLLTILHLVSAKHVHVLTDDGGGVSVPLTRDVPGDLRPGPGVGLGAKCKQEVTRGVIIAASKQITSGALESNIVHCHDPETQTDRLTKATTVCPYLW